MNHSVHNKLISFIWSIADDCLRDIYVRGKYRDVILPMVVLRRIDTLLEPTKQAVLDEYNVEKTVYKKTEPDDFALTKVSGYVFYNTSKWTLKQLHSTAANNRQILLTNFEEYLNGFSKNVQEIIKCFNLKAQIRHMSNKDVLLDVLEKFVSPYINLTPDDNEDPDGNRLPALTNLGMGYVFEELIRKFNEENNEEAGEHFTPREVIELMTHLIFDPIKDNIPPVLTIYDPACGSGGMLTESQNFIEEKYPAKGFTRTIELFGKEINDETYAICKSDMMIKGNDPQNIKVGSTLSIDEFAGTPFDFMLSNPPYGKSWASEQKFIKDGKDIIDNRFKVELKNYWGEEKKEDAVPRSSDGQLLFLMEMVNKMKAPHAGVIGSRIASVHNGSSLFTGDAGGGESNIRRYIIENDMLEAIIQLPNNLFYNTGITTYIWLLSNNKAANRRGKVQLIDASLLYQKLRKNLGDKNCEFSSEHISEITQTYLTMTDIERKLDDNQEPIGIASLCFDNSDFGYYKVNIERPDRRKAQFSLERLADLRFDKSLREVMSHLYGIYGEHVYQTGFLKPQQKSILDWCENNNISLNTKAREKVFNTKYWQKLQAVYESAIAIMQQIGTNEYNDFNQFKLDVDKACKLLNIKLSTSEKNTILNAVSWYDENAEKVIQKIHHLSKDKLATLLTHLECEIEQLSDFGYFATGKTNEYITYEPCSDLRDSESIPLKDNIHRYFLAKVRPYVAEAWINLDSCQIGYEISFNKYFYRHKPLRSLEEVTQDILALEQQADGLIAEILGISSKVEQA